MLNDWYALGAEQYRKWHVYDLEWTTKQGDVSVPINLENYYVCGAPLGGPVAMVLDPRRQNPSAPQPAPAESEKNKILLFTSSGMPLAEIDWQESRPVLAMGWTDQEFLVAVADNGAAKVFDLQGRFVTSFSFLDMTDAITIVEVQFCGSGAAAITTANVIKVVEGLTVNDLASNPPRVYALDPRGALKDKSYTCMAVISPSVSRSGLLEVLLGTSDPSVLVIHESNHETVVEDQLLQKTLGAPITKIALSPDGRNVACYKKDGVLTVMSSAFSSKVIDFDTKSASRPITIEWCGADAVVMQWRNTGLVMVGPLGDWINFPYDASAGMHVVSEPDCCRILTSTGCELLQIVPSATVAALEIGSTEPAALILDAMEAFEEGDPKSDENIRTIAAMHQLNDAVIACIRAAASEFFPEQQQRLMRAASYGKAFCPDFDPAEFVDTARKLRVLNEVRRREIGIPLTAQQYNRLSPEVIVGRLTMRNQHLLALKICELLRLKNERVLIHWACEKVRRMALSGAADDEINAAVKQRLGPFGRISYLAVAEAAYNIGRRRLATIVLDREQQPDDEIPLLLKMNEEELALSKAVHSEETRLVYYTLIALEQRVLPGNKTSEENFFRIVHQHPEAVNLLKIYYRSKVTPSDRGALHRLLLFSKNFLEAGNAAVHQALQQMSSAGKTQLLKEASTLYTQGKDSSFMRVLVDEQLELIDFQKTLEKRVDLAQEVQGVDTEFSNQTLHQTLCSLVELLAVNEAQHRWADAEIQKLVKKFKVSDKTVYHIKIETLAKHKQWSHLAKFAAERKSPVGYRPFALACIKYKALDLETERYIEKISVAEDKFELFVEIRAFSKAVDVAVKLRDPYRLQEVGRICQNPELERYIHEQLSKM